VPAVEDEEAWIMKTYCPMKIGPDWTEDDFERDYWVVRSEFREFKRLFQKIFPPT
jgi:hypothetical protein